MDYKAYGYKSSDDKVWIIKPMTIKVQTIKFAL